jgi:hypothetical protein
MITASDLHGSDGKIRENVDERGAFEIQLESLLLRAQWEDFLATKCQDVRGFLNAKHAAGIIDTGNIPLARWITLRNGAIEASHF